MFLGSVPSWVAVQGFKGSEVQSYVFAPGLHVGDVFMGDAPGFFIANLKIVGALAIMW